MKLPSTRRVLPPALIASVLLGSPAFSSAEPVATPAQAAQGAGQLPATTASQREAAAILQRMSEYLAGLPAFTCSFQAGYDVLQSTGQKIEFGESRRVAMARPDRLRVEEVASDGTRDLALFDGRTMTVMNADAEVFAQAPQPGTVDDALVYFVRDLRMRMPLALLLTTRLPVELPQRVKAIDYVERVDMHGVPTHHLAGRTDTVDFQFWITDGAHPLPLRVVLTYTHAAGQPQYWANFADWDTSPKLAKTVFEFAPPAGARQIPFAVQVPRAPGAAAARGEIQP